MSWLAPWMLAGLATLALPILAHRLGREPPREVPFAAMRFLVAGEPAVSRKRRVRDIGLLIARLILVAALVLAVARPSCEFESDLTMIGEPHDAVVLIDGSRSMGLRVDEKILLEHAGERARQLIYALPAGSQVALLTTDPSGPVVALTEDRDSVVRELDRWIADGAPNPVAARMDASLGVAAELLMGRSEARPAAIYAIGDEANGGISGLPAQVGSIAVYPSPASPNAFQADHVAIQGARWDEARELGEGAVRISVTLFRTVHTPTEDLESESADVASQDARVEREVTVVLEIAGQETARSVVALAPNSPGTIEFLHQREGNAALAARVYLEPSLGDALPSDDQRHLWIDAEPSLQVLLVDGQPSERRIDDELFFLGTALADPAAAGEMRVRTLAPDQLVDRVEREGQRALDGVDVLVLANVAAPPAAVASLIQARVNVGMGLWMTVGDQVEADEYNARFDALLPLRLRATVEAGSLPGRATAKGDGLAPPHRDHSMFSNQGDLGITGARTRKLFLLDPDPSRDMQLALTFESGGPALCTRTVGKGRVALMTTTIDRDWSDLAIRPGFVPIAQLTLRWLGGTSRDANLQQTYVGEPRTLPAIRNSEVIGPGELRFPLPAGDGDADDDLVTLRATWKIGHYEVRSSADATAPTTRFAVVVDPVESDTRPHFASAQGSPEADGASNSAGAATKLTRQEPLWPALLVLAALALLAEGLLRPKSARSARDGATRHR